MSKVDKEAAIKQHYTELNKLGLAGEFERAIKVANKILAVAANETKALHCKIICLIQVSKFDEALKYIERNKEGLREQLIFEKAYCELDHFSLLK